MTESTKPLSRPRVALVAHGIHDHRGGMEHAFSELVRWASRDYDVVVVSSELGEDLRRLVEWKRVWVPTRPMPLRFVLFQLLAGIRVAREDADVVHTLGAIVPNRVDIASAHFCHAGFRAATGRLAPDGPLLRRINTGLTRALSLVAERWSYRPERAGLLTAVSGGLERELREHFPRVRVALVPNGVEGPQISADPDRQGLRPEHGVPDDDFVVLFVGGNWDHKGLQIAIAAIAQARDSGGRQLRLWVVGKGDRSRFTEIARAHDIESRVAFFGPRIDTERFYAAADAVVLPSLYEAFSLVALEALSAGVPLVTTPVNGMTELFDGDPPGKLVERTPESVAQALTELAHDPELRKRMGRAGRRIAGRYTWERSARATLELYREVRATSTRNRGTA